jgi:L-histidine Nalpha-methyltransferase
MGSFRLLGHARIDGAAFADDVRAGLTAPHKRLSCTWFYDREGSHLFEEICALPEYYIPAAETEILGAHAAEMVAAVPPGAGIVELGSGSAVKTRLLLEAHLARAPFTYVPIDISADMLVASSRGLAADHPGLDVVGLPGTYEEGLARLDDAVAEPRLVLWLGSNVGNFDRAGAAAFLAGLRRRLHPRDRVLMGIDLRKDQQTLQLAYDDPAGVTARFNLNQLARINRELGGDFDVGGFAHRAEYLVDEGRIEMRLVSRRSQVARIAALGLEIAFAEGETIHTEDSYKYSPAEIDVLAAAAGMRVAARYLDGARRFCDVILTP